MKCIVVGKPDFQEYYRKTQEDTEKWAYISIECTSDLVTLDVVDDNEHYLEDGPDVLNLDFDDVEEIREVEENGKIYHATPINQKQAEEIIKFAESHMEYNLLVHCMAGQSRSQGVYRALTSIYPEIWNEGNPENPCLTPNMRVVSEIKRAYMKKIYGEDLLE